MSDNTDWPAKPSGDAALDTAQAVLNDKVRMDFLERRAVANAHVLCALGISPWRPTLRAAIDQAIAGDRQELGSQLPSPSASGSALSGQHGL